MKKQLMIFDFVCFGIGAIFLTFVAILQNCGINITNGSVIGIVITVLLFILILLSTANVFGFDCTVSNITFLRPLLLIIALYIFYCMPFMGFFGNRDNNSDYNRNKETNERTVWCRIIERSSHEVFFIPNE